MPDLSGFLEPRLTHSHILHSGKNSAIQMTDCLKFCCPVKLQPGPLLNLSFSSINTSSELTLSARDRA